MTNRQLASNISVAWPSVDDFSEITAYWQSSGQLPAALITGHDLVDSEHHFLIAAIANLRKLCIDQLSRQDCTGCSANRQQTCEADLLSLLGDIFVFILDHFKSEEMIMRDSLLLIVDRDVCEAHMEDHAAISLAVQQIVSKLDFQYVVLRIRELDALLARWVTNHIALHDLMLARWVSRNNSLISHY